MFIIVSVAVLLAPILLIFAIVKLTTIKIPSRPKGYYRSYALLIIAAMFSASATQYALGQIIAGTISFKPISSSTAQVFSIESQPVQFAVFSFLYIAFCAFCIITLIKTHHAIKHHFSNKL
ncbi:hypothetical protein [Pseudomonas sp. XK-1]|uniref:hypothetical protein n=1 Tax=Pseudomonas sp. XK-1 TaxID=3136019 RepID=UPI0031196748